MLAANSPSEHKVLEEAEDKALARLGITYGVLRRLGFSEERVEESLRAISGLDLEEALDWVCHCFTSWLCLSSYPSQLYTICAEEEYLNNSKVNSSRFLRLRRLNIRRYRNLRVQNTTKISQTIVSTT